MTTPQTQPHLHPHPHTYPPSNNEDVSRPPYPPYHDDPSRPGLSHHSRSDTASRIASNTSTSLLYRLPLAIRILFWFLLAVGILAILAVLAVWAFLYYVWP